MEAFTHDEVSKALLELPGWQFADGKIVRDFSFVDFPSAMAFVNRVAELAEQQSHHPDIAIRYNKVRLGLTTHDADGITSRDVALASSIDSLSL